MFGAHTEHDPSDALIRVFELLRHGLKEIEENVVAELGNAGLVRAFVRTCHELWSSCTGFL